MHLLVAEVSAEVSFGERIADVEIGAGIVAGFLAFPGIECALETNAFSLCLSARAIQGLDPIAHQFNRLFRVGMQEAGEHEHFRVPETPSFVNLPSQGARVTAIPA